MNCILLPAVESHLTDTHNDNSLIHSYYEEYTLTDMHQVTHIKQVLRAKVGDTIKVGIESGRLGTAIINQIDNDQIKLTHVECNTLPPAKLDLTVVLALCRPKVMRRLIMDMTAIGVKRIVLVNSYRTHKSYWQSPMLARLDEFVKEGLSQSMDTIEPSIECHTRFKPFVEDVLSQWTYSGIENNHGNNIDNNNNKNSDNGNNSDQGIKPLAIVAHPYASIAFNNYLNNARADRYGQAHESALLLPQIICIGAEGGWIDYEVNLLQDNGCTPVSLGRRILRTEAIVNALCGRYIG